MSDNTTFKNCLLFQTHEGAYPIEPVGGHWGSGTIISGSGSGWTTVTTTNCTIDNDTVVGIYWYTIVFDATNTMQAIISNCHIYNGGKTGSGFILGNFNMLPPNVVATNNVITLQNDYFEELGNNSTTPVGQIVANYPGTINIEGGTLNTTNSATGISQQWAIHLYNTNVNLNIASAGIITPPGIAIQDDGSGNTINVYGNCISANRIYAPLSQVYYPDAPVTSITNLTMAGIPTLDQSSTNPTALTLVTIASGASPLDIPLTITTGTGVGLNPASQLLTISNSVATPYPIDYIAQMYLVNGSGIFHATLQTPQCSNWVNSAGAPCVTVFTPAGGGWTGSSTYGIQLIGHMRYPQ